MHSAIVDASNAEVAAVASRTLGKAEEWARAHHIPVAYGTYEELLEDASITAIYVSACGVIPCPFRLW